MVADAGRAAGGKGDEPPAVPSQPAPQPAPHAAKESASQPGGESAVAKKVEAGAGPDARQTPAGESGLPAKPRFVVRVALYREPRRAVEEVRRLLRRGYNATWSTVVYQSSGTWYGVYVGRYESKEAAAGVGEKLVRERMAQEYKVIFAPYLVEVLGRDNLEARVTKLVERGYPVSLYPRRKLDGASQRLFVGVFGLRRLAAEMRAQLQAEGFQAKLLEP
ncbi:MAG: SPOR domain-containing protein [Candidatus Tectomicrobia bacterium]|nr:SPOR domain-containing protein [Candidatus Tectomicrobia bacterium]